MNKMSDNDLLIVGVVVGAFALYYFNKKEDEIPVKSVEFTGVSVEPTQQSSIEPITMEPETAKKSIPTIAVVSPVSGPLRGRVQLINEIVKNQDREKERFSDLINKPIN